jgi:uncharacterized protein YgbK (DUF1537 family)
LELAIIADDLTGANDTGAQLARNGWKTSVLMQTVQNELAGDTLDVIVIDTDSRALPAEEAYRRVWKAAKYASELGCKAIYKKIDSTMRGNIGIELNAVYDAVEPDFIIVAPAFPQNGRIVKNGVLYVNQVPLAETESARDPKTPVLESYIPTLLNRQSSRSIGLVNYRDLRQGADYIREKLAAFQREGVRYIVFDSLTGKDLQDIADGIGSSGYTVVWSGSAGLANYLSKSKVNDQPFAELDASTADSPVLLVVGSVSEKARQQLDAVLRAGAAVGVMLQSHIAVAGSEREKRDEHERIAREAELALQAGRNVVLYSTGERADIEKANDAGKRLGEDSKWVSGRIAAAIGEAAAKLMEKHQLQGVVMTGGDTAKQVCLQWGALRFELLDEVEHGIPLGRLVGSRPNMYAITKAGGFGSEHALLHAIRRLRKGDLA